MSERERESWLLHCILEHVRVALPPHPDPAVVLALDHYPVDHATVSLSEKLNFCLTIFFAFEMTAKLLAIGPRWYARDRMNVFDAVVVIISVAELIAAPPEFLTGAPSANSSGVLALRTLRLARIFKLARSWTSLRLLLRSTLERAFLSARTPRIPAPPGQCSETRCKT